jgi:hypothetical protein
VIGCFLNVSSLFGFLSGQRHPLKMTLHHQVNIESTAHSFLLCSIATSTEISFTIQCGIYSVFHLPVTASQLHREVQTKFWFHYLNNCLYTNDGGNDDFTLSPIKVFSHRHFTYQNRCRPFFSLITWQYDFSFN